MTVILRRQNDVETDSRVPRNSKSRTKGRQVWTPGCLKHRLYNVVTPVAPETGIQSSNSNMSYRQLSAHQAGKDSRPGPPRDSM